MDRENDNNGYKHDDGGGERHRGVKYKGCLYGSLFFFGQIVDNTISTHEGGQNVSEL
jgi:hypothetical protein